METSRIFVRNLPPTIHEDEFRKFFSRGQITDVKLIPQRRIGYVGYKTPAEAQQAVKYFHRAFIRMSKISVELARPVADPSLYKGKQVHRDHQISSSINQAASNQEASAAVDASKKRKREELGEADPKLQEYLEVMRPVKPSKRLLQAGLEETETKAPLVNGESDDEYEEVPSRQRRRSLQDSVAQDSPTAPSSSGNILNSVDVQPVKALDSDMQDAAAIQSGNDIATIDNHASATAATDDDWLRSRTNRLLDLVDADEVDLDGKETGPPTTLESRPLNTEATRPIIEEEPQHSENSARSAPPAQREDSVLDSIRQTSRLFVRNLPYSASEDELRAFFEKFGPVEEVSRSFKQQCDATISFDIL